MVSQVAQDKALTSADRFKVEFEERVRAKYHLAVITFEEPRAIALMKSVIEARADLLREQGRPVMIETVYRWSRYTGLWRISNGSASEIPKTRDIMAALVFCEQLTEGLVVFCDLGDDVKDPMVARAIRELIWTASGRNIIRGKQARPLCIVLLGPTLPENESLAKEMQTLNLALPGRPEMRSLVEQKADEYEARGLTDLSNADRDLMAQALLGLTQQEAENAVALAVAHNRGLNAQCILTVMDEKANVVRRIAGITYEEPEAKDALGGFEGLKRYFRRVAQASNPRAILFGRSAAKGILLVGPPGVGKDYACKVAAAILARSLIGFHFDQVTAAGGGLYGGAEGVMNRVLATCDVVGPILHISEFEKMLGGMESSGKTDGGTTSRMLARILDWMNEQTNTFVVGTANSLEGLKPEQYRSGRFDKNPMWLGLPNRGERAEILAVHVKKKGRNVAEFDLAAVAMQTKNFSSAELKQVVEDAITLAWEEREGNPDLGTNDLLNAASQIVPLAETSEEVQRIIRWARTAKLSIANTPESASDSEPTAVVVEVD